MCPGSSSAGGVTTTAAAGGTRAELGTGAATTAAAAPSRSPPRRRAKDRGEVVGSCTKPTGAETTATQGWCRLPPGVCEQRSDAPFVPQQGSLVTLQTSRHHKTRTAARTRRQQRPSRRIPLCHLLRVSPQPHRLLPPLPQALPTNSALRVTSSLQRPQQQNTISNSNSKGNSRTQTAATALTSILTFVDNLHTCYIAYLGDIDQILWTG